MSSNFGLECRPNMENALTKCISIKKAVNLKYEWNINNFNTNFDSLESPIFSDGKNLEYRMKIEKKKSTGRPLSTSSLPQQQEDVLFFSRVTASRSSIFCPVEQIIYCIKLFHVSGDAKNVKSHCTFQLVSTIPKNTKTWDLHFQHTVGMSLDCFEIKRHFILNRFNGFLQDGFNNVKLTCKIDAVIEISIPHIVPKCTLLDDCEVIFDNLEFTDFTFYVSGKEFQVHKAILAARSPVFKAMFKHDMEESKNNRVELLEVDAEIFRALLRFVYTGKVPNLNEIAIDLLSLADLYGVENLKVLCVQELCMNISVKNAAQVLILANLHSLEHLKTIAIEYIGSNAVDVSKTEGWNDMIRSHPELFTEVLTNVSIQLLQVLIS